jgi:SAM-dependent methyltransferase
VDTSSQSQQISPARMYEEFLVPALFIPFGNDLLDRADLEPGSKVLDLACGTGILARMVYERLDGNARITGLDINPSMLEVAEDMARRSGAMINWVEGDAQALPFPDASFDLALVQQGLQLVPDKARMFHELLRVLRPGGRLVTSSWTAIENNGFDHLIADAIENRFGSPAFAAPFSLGDPHMLLDLFSSGGFTEMNREVVTRDIRFSSPSAYVDIIMFAASGMLPGLQELDADSLTRLAADVRAEIEAIVDGHSINNELVTQAETAIVTALKPT